MKQAAKEIRLKAASLQDSGLKASRTWSSLRLDQIASHRCDDDNNGNAKDAKPALIRDVDTAPRISDSTRRSLADWIGADVSRRTFSFLIDAMLEKENDCDRKEKALMKRPTLKSLDDLEEALKTWTETRGVTMAPKSDGEKDGAAHHRKPNRPPKTPAALLAEAHTVMNRIMERCVELTAAEKTLSEQGAFSVNF